MTSQQGPSIHPGRRGQCLLLLGLVYVLVGYDYITAGPLPETSQNALHLALLLAPLDVWGVLWAGGGVIALVTAFWPAERDGFGFAALTGLAIAWACVYLSGAVLFDAPRAWTGALSWLAVLFLLQVIAGWPEVPTSDKQQPRHRRGWRL